MIQRLRFDGSGRKKFSARRVAVRLCLLLMAAPSLLALPAAAQTGASDARAQRFAETAADIARTFPLVEHISIDEYRAQHTDALLIDVRSAEEYQVSRIPGAVNAATRDQLLVMARDHRQQHPRTQIVLYCSLGWRSGDAAEYLRQQGVGGVMNLQGSIFAWGNRSLPVENAAGPAQKIHSYNLFWGWRYLDESRR